MALRNGWEPLPWPYAAVPGQYRWFADLVLKRANEIRVEEIDRVVEAVGAHVGAAVARSLGAR